MRVMKFWGVFLFVCMLVGAGHFAAMADEPVRDEEVWGEDDSNFRIGVGACFETAVYKGVDDEVMPRPMVDIEFYDFFIRGKTIGYEVFELDDFVSFSLIASPRFDGYEASDSKYLRGMDERKMSFDAGACVEFETDFCEIEISALADLTGEHDGQEVELEISRGLFDHRIMPYIGVVWQSSNLVDYYYGVKESEAIEGRPAYKPESTAVFFVGCRGQYEFAENWLLCGDVEYEVFGSEIKDSPIVEDSSSVSVTIGVCYSF